jgi:putative redox protein
VKAVAKRVDGFAHDISVDGHLQRVDEPPEAGGSDTGPRPTHLLGASLAGCIAITLEMYAERKGWDVGAVEVDVEMIYEGVTPKAFDVRLKLPGDLDEEQRRRLLVIATKCPVHKVLAGEAHVNVVEHIERS